MQLTINTGSAAEFFQRHRELARLADAGTPLPAKHILSFQDPAEVIKLVSRTRLALFKAVKDMPGSIT